VRQDKKPSGIINLQWRIENYPASTSLWVLFFDKSSEKGGRVSFWWNSHACLPEQAGLPTPQSL